ncbi:MAG: SLBB domain-containing protein [bacterium]
MNRKFAVLFLLLIFFTLAPSCFPQINKRTVIDTSRFNHIYDIGAKQFYSGKTQPLENNLNRSNNLSLFGIDLFNKKSPDLSREKAEVYILPPNYTLGPGDRIGIYLLGKVQENLEVTVNVEGKIFVPPAGVIPVWGLEMEAFNKLLSKKLSKYYDNFKLDLMLLQPKNVMVAVVGEVFRPGKYVLSAMNTVLDAIILAGGPTEKGSIRDVRLIRNAELYASVDLYQFLMHGNDEYDVFLQAGDRIFVPLAQNKVTVDGEIKRPSIFELKPGLSERLTDVITLAGGFTDYAFEDKIEISRLKANGQRKLLYANFTDIIAGDSTQNYLLQNEDKVRVYSKLEQIHERTVAIFGEIRKPGTYDLEDNMHLSDLILKAGNLTRKAYTLEAEVAKIDPGYPTKFLKINLQELNSPTNGHTDILLEEDDQIFIRQIPEWEVGLTVDVRGEVRFPGKYSIVKDSTYLSEILTKAGGFTNEAFLKEAVVIRPSTRLKYDKDFERLKEMRREEMSDLEYQYLVMRQNTSNVDQIVVDFEKLVYEHDRSQDVTLEDGDVIVIPKSPKVVMVTGRVANAGGVTFVPNAKLKYYLEKAGGASWDANLKQTKIIKVTGEVVEDENVQDFQPGDIIWVPRKSDKKIWPLVLQTISVMAQLASIYLIIDTAANR